MADVFGTIEEKKALQKSSTLKILIAIALMVGGVIIMGVGSGGDANSPMAMIGMVIRLIGIIPWFWGLADYGKSKGYSPFIALLGLLSCIGLIILVVLPDKFQIRQPQAYDPNSNYPR
ncbi:MAG: hypothetical protein ACO1SV_19320 [Fimbriimonas sp.]